MLLYPLKIVPHLLRTLRNYKKIRYIIPMYNLLECSGNYSDSSGRLYQFKRDEPPSNNGNISVNASS